MRKAVVLVAVAACFPALTAGPELASTPSPAVIQHQQREAFARSMGYPTKKSPEELEATVLRHLKGFKPSRHSDGRLEAPQPLAIDGVRGTCYTVVIRLGAGATWGLGAEAGLRFDFQTPTGPGSGGPGVTGPGAVASVGCAEADGPITLAMAPMVGSDPIGTGPYTVELWSRTLTRAEAAHLEADKQQQIREQREFAQREAAKKHDRESRGCSKCEARYQGCVGAHRGDSTCRDEYRSCAFQEAGADYLAVCPHP
jgi:hypothetical protein